MRGPGRWLVIVAAVVLTPGAVASCGDDDSDGARSASTTPQIAYVKQSDDVGNARALERLVNLFAQMQRDFHVGRMEAVCDHVSASWLSQFPLDARRPDVPCEAKLTEFAHELRRANTRPRTLPIMWTRIYPAIAGITVRGTGHPRMRIPFVWEDGAWKLQLGVFPAPEVLNDRLAVR